MEIDVGTVLVAKGGGWCYTTLVIYHISASLFLQSLRQNKKPRLYQGCVFHGTAYCG